MKQRNFSKKLSLNKKTVANLGKEEMTGIHGGDSLPKCVSTNLGCPFTAGYPFTVCDPACLSITGTPESDPCCM
jgi:hypothetical protein